MGRKFKEKELLIASANKGKIKEYNELLAKHDIEIRSTDEFNLEDPEETGTTYIDNACLKANYYGEKTGLPALADDSGISIDALDGAPGIYSARWAIQDGKRNFNYAFEKIRKALDDKGLSTSKAKFVCAIALRWVDGHIEKFVGEVEGELVFPPRGEKGFGYDPIFIPNGYFQTFAEMEEEFKNSISHRMKAFTQMLESCFDE